MTKATNQYLDAHTRTEPAKQFTKLDELRLYLIFKRHARNMTQKQLAKKLKIAQATVCRYEVCLKVAQVHILIAWCDYFKVPLFDNVYLRRDYRAFVDFLNATKHHD